MKWIKIEDEIPPLCQDVLLACKEGVIMGWQENDTESGEEPSWCSLQVRHRLADVTHWMHLPDHPTDPRSR
jgi:hypothetical protein